MSEPCQHCWHLVERNPGNFHEICCFCGMERVAIPSHKLEHGRYLPGAEIEVIEVVEYASN